VAGVTFIDGREVYDIHKETQSASKSIEILCHQICHGNQKPQHQDVLDILTHQKSKQGFSKTSLSCEVLVNAAGAWAAELALKYDHQVECSPLRRQMSLFNCKEIDLQNYGMIVDSSGLYFHAESDHILAGYATPQERTGFNFKYDGEPFFESEIWPKLLNRMSRAEALKHLSGWAGLYSVTPDRSGVMGQVDDKYKIYEAHSFTGRGAMQSHGVGLAMSELIIEKKYMTIDASSLHPNRFRSAHGKLLYEGMHI
jgi:glycine/D-amino acid oxidase-like deaminating enzyme